MSSAAFLKKATGFKRHMLWTGRDDVLMFLEMQNVSISLADSCILQYFHFLWPDTCTVRWNPSWNASGSGTRSSCAWGRLPVRSSMFPSRKKCSHASQRTWTTSAWTMPYLDWPRCRAHIWRIKNACRACRANQFLCKLWFACLVLVFYDILCILGSEMAIRAAFALLRSALPFSLLQPSWCTHSSWFLDCAWLHWTFLEISCHSGSSWNLVISSLLAKWYCRGNSYPC